jgi:DNA-binding LacI/PurR family transcriptional regulator
MEPRGPWSIGLRSSSAHACEDDGHGERHSRPASAGLPTRLSFDSHRVAVTAFGNVTPRRPTIVNVAERAGVSKSLVSLIMRGAPNVSDESRRAVLQAAEELGYRPNLAARNLAERRTRTLGVLVSDLHNPFFAVILDAMQSAVRQHGLRILMGSGRRNSAEEAEVIESFLQQDVEGLVLLSPVVSRDDLARAAAYAPTVVVGRTDIRVPHCDVIINDNELGGELVVQHLLERGHTRIAYIDAQSGPGASERRAGYLAAMGRHGLEPAIAGGDFTEDGGYRGGRELLAQPALPTAIFACNDVAAIGAMTALEESGISVPGDVSLVGYDNTSLAAMRHIALTTVDQPRQAMGELAVELLQRRRERRTAPGRVRLVEPQLIERGTTAQMSPRPASARVA